MSKCAEGGFHGAFTAERTVWAREEFNPNDVEEEEFKRNGFAPVMCTQPTGAAQKGTEMFAKIIARKHETKTPRMKASVEKLDRDVLRLILILHVSGKCGPFHSKERPESTGSKIMFSL